MSPIFSTNFQGQMSRSKFKIVNFIHKDLVFSTVKFKSEVNKYILNKGQRSNQ